MEPFCYADLRTRSHVRSSCKNIASSEIVRAADLHFPHPAVSFREEQMRKITFKNEILYWLFIKSILWIFYTNHSLEYGKKRQIEVIFFNLVDSSKLKEYRSPLILVLIYYVTVYYFFFYCIQVLLLPLIKTSVYSMMISWWHIYWQFPYDALGRHTK